MQTQAVSPYLPLCYFSSLENKAQMTKSSFVWAKVVNFLDENKDLSRVAETSFLLRAIVWMKWLRPNKYFPSFSPLKVKADNKFEEMKGACLRLPTFRLLKAAGVTVENGILANDAIYKAIQLVSHKEFFTTLESYFEVLRKCQCSEEAWLGPVCHEIADITNQTFYPYASKVIVEPNMRRIFRGDMHGDVLSFLLFIDRLQKEGYTSPKDPFKLIKPLKIFFLGDYVDRGVWGLEVIFLLMQLKIKNPDSVFCTRGNHEDPEMADRLGFYQEYMAKFGKEDPEGKDYQKLAAFYHSLPVGFMWHEFNVEPEDKTSYFEERKVFSCNKALTSAALTVASLKINTINAIIRAHQHAPDNPLMKLLLKTKGCVHLWDDQKLKDGSVITLLLTPDNTCSGVHVGLEVPFTYDTTLEIFGGPKLEDMKCTVTNNEIYT